MHGQALANAELSEEQRSGSGRVFLRGMVVENSNNAPITYGVENNVPKVNKRPADRQRLNFIKFISDRINDSLTTFVAMLSRIVNMTVEERRQLQKRAVGAAACAAAAAYGAPQIAHHAADQKQQEAFLDRTTELADALNATRNGEDMISALDLARPWTQQVSYEPQEEADSEIKPVSVQAFVDLMANLEPRMGIDAAEQQRRDHGCLSEAIYYEARSESLEGQLGVGEVILNRVASEFYPDDVCSVVYQGSSRVTGCQFSFTCDGSMRRRPRGEAWDQSRAVAANILMGSIPHALTGDATHYHTDYVDPYWNVGLVQTRTIGTHIFYRFPETGREWAAARTRQAAARYAARHATPLSDAVEDVQTVALTTEELQARELERLSEKDI